MGETMHSCLDTWPARCMSSMHKSVTNGSKAGVGAVRALYARPGTRHRTENHGTSAGRTHGCVVSAAAAKSSDDKRNWGPSAAKTPTGGDLQTSASTGGGQTS